MENEFVKCGAYPSCRHHKCDCYENYLMSQHIPQQDLGREVPKIRTVKDMKKYLKQSGIKITEDNNKSSAEYIIVNKTDIQKSIKGLLEGLSLSQKNTVAEGIILGSITQLKQILSKSFPLITDLKDIQIWLSKQKYQKEQGEQEYMMYYDVDIPKIIRDYIIDHKLKP